MGALDRVLGELWELIAKEKFKAFVGGKD
jgi:hypothetical protein